jgi:pimeloyl-ACP methyl ester carboxylesterase
VLRSACGSCATDLHRALRRGADGPVVLDALTALSIARPDFPGVAAALRRAAAGDRRRLDRLVAATRRAQAAPATVLSQGLHAATLCAELSPARSVGRVWPFDARTATHNGLAQLCRNWPAVSPPANVDHALPPVPTLLLEGARDLSTNVAWMRQEARLAPNPTIRILPGVGHAVLRERAGLAAVRNFLARSAQNVRP